MKQKIIPFLAFLLCGLSMQAQFTVRDSDNNAIVDGDVVTYNQLTYPEASLDFFVKNESATDNIYMKIEFVSATNADGSMMELCFGLCYTGITIGNIYPPNADFIEIAPGEETLQGNHMYNSDPGNGNDVIEYVFRFFQIDTNGDEIGDDLTMTYAYDPNLSVGDFNTIDASIVSTVVTNEMQIDTRENLTVVVYDIQGKQVKQQAIETGRQTVDMSGLSANMYVVQLTNEKGASTTTKVIVR